MYSDKSSGFVLSGFFPISSLSYFLLSIVSVVLILLDLNYMSLCFIVQFPGYLVNLIIPFFQLTSGLCLTNQLCPRNMSIPFRSVTATSKISLCPLISISRDAILVTSPFFVPLALEYFKREVYWLDLNLFVFDQLFIDPYVHTARVHQCFHFQLFAILYFDICLHI